MQPIAMSVVGRLCSFVSQAAIAHLVSSSRCRHPGEQPNQELCGPFALRIALSRFCLSNTLWHRVVLQHVQLHAVLLHSVADRQTRFRLLQLGQSQTIKSPLNTVPKQRACEVQPCSKQMLHHLGTFAEPAWTACCVACRSWYIGLFQWPWLPELMMRSRDHAFVDAAFTAGPMACKTPGAVSPEHISHFKWGLRQPNACTAALDYYRAFVDSTSRFPALAGALLSRSAQIAIHTCPDLIFGYCHHQLAMELYFYRLYKHL